MRSQELNQTLTSNGCGVVADRGDAGRSEDYDQVDDAADAVDLVHKGLGDLLEVVGGEMPFEGENPLAHLAQDVPQCEVPAQSQPVLSLPPDLPAAGDG